jgi:hypothetical protein
MKPEAYLFDLDDTILTDNAVSEKCWREGCQEWALSNSQVSPDDLASSIREAPQLVFSRPRQVPLVEPKPAKIPDEGRDDGF